LSEAPHDVPQAAPHAAGFSSGLSDPPHDVPQAAAAFVFVSSFHAAMFDNAIFLPPVCLRAEFTTALICV
jgi:hypothetical protein